MRTESPEIQEFVPQFVNHEARFDDRTSQSEALPNRPNRCNQLYGLEIRVTLSKHRKR